jgi:hypothetical protein
MATVRMPCLFSQGYLLVRFKVYPPISAAAYEKQKAAWELVLALVNRAEIMLNGSFFFLNHRRFAAPLPRWRRTDARSKNP